MTLEEKIKADLKEAIKSGDDTTRDVLRFLSSDIKNEAIKLRKELEEKDVVNVIKRGIKSRKDSVEQYTNGGRADLAEKEQKEISVLEKYMPEQMSEDEIKAIVQKVIQNMDATQAKNFGLVMKEVMKETEGRADGSVVSKVVKETLVG